MVRVYRTGAAALDYSLAKVADRVSPVQVMPSRFSSNRHKRGKVSGGHGRIGKHRGRPGGRGLAGGQHHHRVAFDKL